MKIVTTSEVELKCICPTCGEELKIEQHILDVIHCKDYRIIVWPCIHCNPVDVMVTIEGDIHDHDHRYR